MRLLLREASPELGDALGDLAADLDRLAAIVEVLQFREDTILYCVKPSKRKQKIRTTSTKRNDTYAARYDTGDPYAQFANEGGPGIQGKLLTCKKGCGALAKTAPRHLRARATSSLPTA